MAKKKGLFTVLKRVFISEANSEKKEKRRKWSFWKLKVKKRLPSITAPPEHRTIQETHEEHKEENVSDEDEFISQLSCDQQFLDYGSASPEAADLIVQHQMSLHRQAEFLAATWIQTAFRGHLARKALCALKGIVKLQAYIRGRAVRRQAITTLKCLQSVVNIQSQVCANRTRIPEHRDYEERYKFLTFTENALKVDTNGQKRWDGSLLTKEEAEAVVMSKREASRRRERIKEYAIAHRKSAESYQKRGNTKWKYWLDEWVDTQRTKSKELEDLDLFSKTKPKDNKIPRNSSPRRCTNNHRRQVSLGEMEQTPTPTYMVATESAKAKSRSSSSTGIRPRSFDTQSESFSPYKNKLCLTNVKASAAYQQQQRSPGLRGFNIGGPLRSGYSNTLLLNDVSVDSDVSLRNWNKQSSSSLR